MSVPDHVRIIKTALTWAGIDWETHNCTINDYRELPPSMLKQLRHELGSQLKLLNLHDTFKWECIHCGHCCEKKHIARHNLSSTEKQALLLNNDKLPTIDGTCKFFGTNCCKAYGYRPHPCRLFPLHVLSVNFLGDDRQYLALFMDQCPGLGKGNTWTARDYLLHMGILADYFV